MARANLTDKLRQIRKRRLVAEFCRRCGKSRTWFYNAERDQMAKEMTHIDAVLAISGHPIVAAREATKRADAMREAERYLTVMASPRAAKPLPLVTNEAKPRRTGFNFTTGQ